MFRVEPEAPGEELRFNTTLSAAEVRYLLMRANIEKITYDTAISKRHVLAMQPGL